MVAVFWLINTVISLAVWSILISVILSWLIAFNVINPYQPFVRSVGQFLNAITEPMLRPIRTFMGRMLPSTGGMDLSPLVAILALQFLQIFIATSIRPIFY